VGKVILIKVGEAGHGLTCATRYISCIFEDPFDGVTPESAVLHALKRLLDMGCYEVSLGDTLGTGTTADVRRVLTYLYDHGILAEKLAGHFHDTYGQAVLNVWTAYELGIRVFDSSVGGLGGCPYAPGAKGNVATEDLVYLFQRAGIETGVDLQKLSETGQWISQQLRKPNDSRAGAALARKAQPASKPPTCQDLEWTTLPTETDGLQILRSGLNVKIILNRPNNGNALTSSMIAEITLFFEAAASNTAISRIVLTGDGNFFCTGMDLGKDCAVAKSAEVSNDQFKRLSRLFEAIFNSPQVTIAAINGPAFGTGVGLAFACDIRIGTANATLTLSEVKPGLSPTAIFKHVAREWGLAFTREAMLSNRAVPFAQLLSLGIVAEMVASKAELDGALNRYLGMLHNAGTRASTPVKELVRVGMAGNAEGVQASRIIQVFEEMMKPGSEAEFGAREFLAGRRDVDWDAVQVVQGRAKL
jgi:hydroxymethylglutaryl-CoA lyase